MKTYQVKVFETAAEFFDACPLEPSTVYVVFDGSTAPRFSGEGARGYEFNEVTQEQLMQEAWSRAGGGRLYLT